MKSIVSFVVRPVSNITYADHFYMTRRSNWGWRAIVPVWSSLFPAKLSIVSKVVPQSFVLNHYEFSKVPRDIFEKCLIRNQDFSQFWEILRCHHQILISGISYRKCQPLFCSMALLIQYHFSTSCWQLPNKILSNAWKRPVDNIRPFRTAIVFPSSARARCSW